MCYTNHSQNLLGETTASAGYGHIARRIAAARTQHSRAVAELIAGAARAVLAAIRRFIADARRRREEQANHRALAELDARTLRDIGLDRSETRREIAGGDATRVRAPSAPRGLQESLVVLLATVGFIAAIVGAAYGPAALRPATPTDDRASGGQATDPSRSTKESLQTTGN